MRNRYFNLIPIAALCAALLPNNAFAAKPPRIPAWHNGNVVFFTVVNENVDGINAPHSDGVAIPFYAVIGPQFEVLSAVPGHAGYNPWWHVFLVIILDGRDVSTDPFTSEQEILNAAADGDVLLIDTEFVFLCQVLEK
ncbi:MAG: hypothetical protein L0212_08065 [Acidobacteria bacterium]|nr:hypothetical protein [Acidobacteriota bacterium]